MIIVKNSQLNNDTIESINSLIEMDIKATEAFKLMRIIKELSSLVEDKAKLEKKIFDKWVEKNEDGTPVLATNDKGESIPNAVKIKDISQFNADMTELMVIENQIDHEKINFEDLKLETAKVKNLMKIDFLFN